ncbi:hypothetical protein GCM10027429_34020 [Marivirga atlantica]|uniref:PKD domain-containing protein n=1 Tax=Marivirga atlantica TaxID=1548457 RepID=A0A937DIG3_9BACT|nr:PKD domain-containing protein [Marivirga atlantica]MBL0766983.1 PKD domain-containing protein [Marivirga atlantica]
MFKNLKYGLIALVFIFSACDNEKEGSEPLEANFTVEVEGEAPNATLNFVNESTGATSYEWSFGEGSNESTSTAESPSNISVDKAGDLTITLSAIAGNDESTSEKTVNIAGNSAITEIKDIEFSQVEGSNELGRFYSISQNRMYLDSEIDESNGQFIDLFYKGDNSSFIFFEGPKDNFDGINVPNAKETKVHNSQSGFEVSTFDDMDNDAPLEDLTVVNDDNVIGSLDFPLIVTFETEGGKKGAIKLKQINSTRLLVDIKVQKY